VAQRRCLHLSMFNRGGWVVADPFLASSCLGGDSVPSRDRFGPTRRRQNPPKQGKQAGTVYQSCIRREPCTRQATYIRQALCIRQQGAAGPAGAHKVFECQRTFLDTNAGAVSGSSARRRAMSAKDRRDARLSSSSMPRMVTATCAAFSTVLYQGAYCSAGLRGKR